MSADRRVYSGGPGYPELLDQITDPPASLNIRGEIIREDLLSVAVVGSRNATPYGRHMARIISGGLAASGVTVVSGLARGIDTEAHRAALDKGGRTLAVLGCGLDIDYPRGAGELRRRIIASGALLSEFDPGTPPLPRNFPSRNRIISGLSLAVVVVQAKGRSGSLITARWALDQGREVMAVPGRADDPLSAGPVVLLRDGASPVCNSDDILRVLGLDNMIETAFGSGCDQQQADPVLRALKPGPHLPEDLVKVTGMPLPQVLSELSKLELEGLVIRDPGGMFALR
ncbi:MAG: DNA-processing protein DprA [bacterium]|nr:DNA-processing protein DprA [bacterium]